MCPPPNRLHCTKNKEVTLFMPSQPGWLYQGEQTTKKQAKQKYIVLIKWALTFHLELTFSVVIGFTGNSRDSDPQNIWEPFIRCGIYCMESRQLTHHCLWPRWLLGTLDMERQCRFDCVLVREKERVCVYMCVCVREIECMCMQAKCLTIWSIDWN